VLRVVSHPRYSNSQPVQAVADSLDSLLAVGEHTLVADAVSLLSEVIDRTRLLSSGQVTDTYLLAIAIAHDAQLATFDTKIVTTAVPGGSAAVTQIRCGDGNWS